MDAETEALARDVLAAFRARGAMIVTVESCTGGLVAGALTAIPGSSDVVDRGFVTYSNGAKQDLVGVPAAVLSAHGAVSEETARAMARGGLERSAASVAVAVTGVAGPGGGSPEKPVGLVHFAAARRGAGDPLVVSLVRRYGSLSRDAIRAESVKDALRLALQALSASSDG